jgi:hypothetical protein
MMQGVKDASPLYEVERRAEHAARRGVTNGGDASAAFLVLQGIREYDFVALVEK